MCMYSIPWIGYVKVGKLQINQVRLNVFMLIVRTRYLTSTRAIFMRQRRLTRRNNTFLLIRFTNRNMIRRMIRRIFFQDQHVIPTNLYLHLSMITRNFLRISSLLMRNLQFRILLTRNTHLITTSGLTMLRITRRFRSSEAYLINARMKR